MLLATTVGTLLTSDREETHSWIPLPQQALPGLLGGRPNLTPSPDVVLIKPSSACERFPVSLVLPPLPRGSLEESTGVGPRNHLYDLRRGEEGLPLKQVWVSDIRGGL